MADFLTFKEIYQAVERLVKQSGGRRDLATSVINMAYLDEILEADDLYPMFWLRKMVDSKAAFAPTTITGITIAAQGLITAANTFSEGDVFSVYNIVGTTELNNRTFKVGSVALGLTTGVIPIMNLDGIAVSTVGMTAWASGGIVNHRGITMDVNKTQRILSAAWHDEQDMREITSEELEEEQRWWDDASTRPERYMQYKSYDNAGAEVNLMLWFPASSQAYDLRYWEVIRGTLLSADGDVPLLPPQFHNTIISGAAVRLIESNAQVENAVVWPGIYTAQLEAIRSFNRKFYQSHEFEQREPSLYL